jgi:hypothetical protein
MMPCTDYERHLVPQRGAAHAEVGRRREPDEDDRGDRGDGHRAEPDGGEQPKAPAPERHHDAQLEHAVREYPQRHRQRGVVDRHAAGRRPRHRDRERIDVGQPEHGAGQPEARLPQRMASRMDAEQYQLEKRRHLERRPDLERVRRSAEVGGPWGAAQ